VMMRLTMHHGRVAVDAERALGGRGAYLHKRQSCVEAFARRGGFVRSLRCVIPKAERDALRARIAEE
jgi:predicted RNA-binding protein YlxR (DUF448 family)